jgi:hypothetical protein
MNYPPINHQNLSLEPIPSHQRFSPPPSIFLLVTSLIFVTATVSFAIIKKSHSSSLPGPTPITTFGTHSSLLSDSSPTTPETTPLPILQPSFTYELSLSNSFLKKAVELSNSIPNQTPADKQKIIDLLNQSLISANRAIAADPYNPAGYQMRAKINLTVATINPEAKLLAQQDLETAKKLGANPNEFPEIKTDPMELIPLEEASLASNIIIASPQENQSTDPINTRTATNAITATVTIPASQTQVSISLPLNPTDLIYLIPENNFTNAAPYLLSKSTTGFTIAIDSPLNSNLNITYWVIPQ